VDGCVAVMRGMRSFTSAITTGAQRAAVSVQSTVVPRLMIHVRRAATTCMRTTSSGKSPRERVLRFR